MGGSHGQIAVNLGYFLFAHSYDPRWQTFEAFGVDALAVAGIAMFVVSYYQNLRINYALHFLMF